MKCVYTYGQKDSLTLDKLVEIYYKSGALLTNKKIFSTEEIVNSTYSKIIEQVKLKDEILKSSETTLDENGNVVSSNKIALTAFISQENEALNSALRRSSIRFSPEYREPERILKFVKDKLIDAGEDVSKIKNLSELQDKPGYEGYLNEITTTIEAEKKSNILMSGLKSAIFRVLKDIDFITNVERELRKYLEPAVDRAITDNLLSEVDKNSMINKLIIGAQDIVSQVSRYGKPIVDVILNTEEDNPQQIIGHIDIITIDNDGNAHIFSIRSSKRTYND